MWLPTRIILALGMLRQEDCPKFVLCSGWYLISSRGWGGEEEGVFREEKGC